MTPRPRVEDLFPINNLEPISSEVMSNGRHDGNDGADLVESEGVQRKPNGKQAGAPDIHH